MIILIILNMILVIMLVMMLAMMLATAAIATALTMARSGCKIKRHASDGTQPCLHVNHFIYTQVCVCIYIYIYIHIHTYTHTMSVTPNLYIRLGLTKIPDFFDTLAQ